MKLLGWMQRKLRQNTNETTPKDFHMDDVLHCYQKGNHGSKAPFGKSQRGNYSSFEHEDDDDDMIKDVFHGFLAIGTLGGTEQFISSSTEPPTPTFSISEKETENELKLINDELEKVLGDDVRISCSLSGKPNIESGDTCPLQSYLFGGVADTTAPPPPAKKEQRTSLGDLFQKTNKHHDDNTKNDKSAVHVMRKMLKKTVNKSSTPIDSDKKLHKILQMFNRKVHPENPTAAAAAAACQKPKKSNVGSDHTDEDIIIYPQQQQAAAADTSKDIISCCKSQSLTTGNHEFWVKTDADYLVLEL